MSYFEWVQNIENEQWDIEEVNNKLRRKIQRAVDSVIDRWQELKDIAVTPENSRTSDDAVSSDGCCIDLRTAALVVAIGRVAQVALERGIWP